MMLKLASTILLSLWLALAPAIAQQSVVIPATEFSIPISISTATTTLLASGATGQQIYVTAVDFIAAGTGNIQFIAGTGGTCTGTPVNITGNYNLAASVGLSKGTGNGALWVIPKGFNLCAVTSAAIGIFGSLS